jgi:hypothetical protein
MTWTIDTEQFGSMPNQAEGTLNGQPFYFRARHGGWVLRVSPRKQDLWDMSCPDTRIVAHGEHAHAGWWENDEARAFLETTLMELDHAPA